MEIAITFGRDELMRAIQEFLPLRVMLGTGLGGVDPAWVEIEALGAAQFLPRRGLSVSCSARVHYPRPVVPDDFVVEHATLEMVPGILAAPGGPVLAFKLKIGDFDVRHLPNGLDQAIGRRINEALREHASAMAWDFSSSLRAITGLPGERHGARSLGGERHGVGSLELGQPRGEVRVTDEAIILSLAVDVMFPRDDAISDLYPPLDAGKPASEFERRWVDQLDLPRGVAAQAESVWR